MSDFTTMDDNRTDDLQIDDSNKDNHAIPDELPILPLRGLVVYPETALPLTIGQPRSIKLIDDVVGGNRMIGMVTSRDPENENPNPESLYQYGTVAIIQRLFRAPDGTIRLLVQGIQRIRLGEFTSVEPYLKAKVIPTPEIVDSGLEVDALVMNVRKQFEHIADLLPSIPRELVASLSDINDPLSIVYLISNFQKMEIGEAQKILELDSLSDKLKRLTTVLAREIEILELGQKIQNDARTEIDKVQREYYLREQLKAIQKELGENDEQAVDIENFRNKITAAKLRPEAEKQANRELDRLSRLPTTAAEYGVIRTYLDWVVSLPWSLSTQDNLDIIHARKVLEEDHFGLEDVKQRILEFLAVRKLRQEQSPDNQAGQTTDTIRREREGVILCFVGPPGVGKTSLGQSISRAMGRKFIRISLGGIHDEAEIRGHRRTYIGAMPGKIIQAIRRVETHNPVFMLDEIDKLTLDFHGDPASALLEVLDPEQNSDFRDNYLDVGFDLSPIMFITTANTTGTILGPLLDRMEVIKLSGYTEGEKVQIAQRYLIPRQLKENGLTHAEVAFSKTSIEAITRFYTRESGVRNLDREIGAVCRKAATAIIEGKPLQRLITPKVVREMLGKTRFGKMDETRERTSLPGIATGLAWTPVGGEVLFIEASKMEGARGFKITGSVGNVMQESAQAALTYVRSKAEHIGLNPLFFDTIDIHLHIPAGATPKDGPSAGVTMTTALVSLLLDKAVRPNLAMTGEVTLSGKVLPVGGIKEKVLAAHRAGIKIVVLPKQNQQDLDELPEEVKKAIQFKLVRNMDEVLKLGLDLKPNKNTKNTIEK